MDDPVSKIDKKITQLKKRKEKIQTHKAISFLKEAQRVLGERFSPNLAISILSNIWKSSSESQKQEWEKAGFHFNENEKNKEDENTPHSFRKSAKSTGN